MAFAAGTLSQLSVGATTDSLASTAATGGTGPYTYQWYRSTTTGFTPGVGNIIAGATALTLNDSGLIPNTIYYYKVVATDTGNSNVTATSSQLVVTTTATTLNPNSFQQTTVLGMVDLQFSANVVAVQIDLSQATPLYQGSAVKMVDSADGIPKVIGCTANSDEVLGFINYDIKNVAYLAGNRAEISLAGTAMYLYATGAISRGTQVQLDITSPGGVAQIVPASGADVVGWAYDKAATAGSLIRVYLKTPSFSKA